MYKKKFITSILITAVSILALLFLCRHIGINITRSVPFWVYTIDRQNRHFTNGSYVLFRLDKDPLKVLPQKALLVKKIVCAPGMKLITTDDEFICDGKRAAVLNDKENMKFSFTGIVPNNMYFMSGEHIRSYDSRIWGFLNEKDIIAVVNPVF